MSVTYIQVGDLHICMSINYIRTGVEISDMYAHSAIADIPTAKPIRTLPVIYKVLPTKFICNIIIICPHCKQIFLVKITEIAYETTKQHFDISENQQTKIDGPQNLSTLHKKA